MQSEFFDVTLCNLIAGERAPTVKKTFHSSLLFINPLQMDIPPTYPFLLETLSLPTRLSFN